MMVPYDITVRDAQIAHLAEHANKWTDERPIGAYFDEYWAQYEEEGIASGDGPGELYRRCCAGMGIEPKPELIT